MTEASEALHPEGDRQRLYFHVGLPKSARDRRVQLAHDVQHGGEAHVGADRAHVGTDASATVGTTFVGTNQRGPARWQTRCRVTASDPGRRFTFDVFQFGPRILMLTFRIATWDYAFEAKVL